MKDKNRRITARGSFVALLGITLVLLAPVAYVFFFLGVAIHSQVYLANPDLGPDGWTQYTEEIFDSVMMVIGPLFALLCMWIVASGVFVALLTRKRSLSNTNLEPISGS